MTVALRSDSEAANAAASTSVVVTKPAGTANGDVLVAIISETGTGSITPPAGWTLLGSQAAAATVTSAVYYKVAASEGASWTWTLGASVRNTYWCGAFTGVDVSSPIYASTSTADTDGGLTVDTAAVDPVLIPWAGLITSVAGVRTAGGAATTWTQLQFTEVADVSTNGGAGTDITAAVTALTPTQVYSSWVETYTASQTQSAVASWAIALRPAFTSYDGGLITGIVVKAAYGQAFDDGFGTYTYTDISSDVREDKKVTITSGRPSNSGSAPPASISLDLNNANGQHTPLLPTGTHYPDVRRSLPIIVEVPYGYAPNTSRGAGYASSIQPAWDESLQLATCKLQALGPMARLQKMPGDPQSALYRSMIGAGGVAFSAVAPVAYWPMEDRSGSRSLASATGGPAISFSSASTVAVASDSSLAGSSSLPVLSTGAAWSGTVPAYTQTGLWSVGHVINIPTAVAATSPILEVICSGTARRWVLEVTPGTPDTIHLRAYDAAAVSLLDVSTSLTEADFYDKWSLISLSVATNGTGVDYAVRVTAAYPSTTTATITGTLASRTHGLAQTVRGKASVSLNGTAIGHYAVYTDPTMTAAAIASQSYAAMTGNTGELPYDRVFRLCGQAGITVRASNATLAIATAGNVLMGPQPVGTLPTLLRECEDVAQALLHDAGWTQDQAPGSAEVGVLTWVSREDRYNAASVMTLDFDAGEVEYYGPVLDDLMLRNDVTAVDSDGGSARVIDQDSAAVEGGLYGEGRTYNLYDETDTVHIAGWRVNLGTVEQMRAPQVRINLRRKPGLLPEYLYLKPGDKITLTNPPSQMAPDDIVLIVEGITETLSVDTWRATLNCVAAEPYTVAVWDSATYGKWDTAGSELHSAGTSTGTSLAVATTSGPLWTTTDAEDGFAWFIGGEKATVTDIAPSLVTYGSVGTAAHGNNASVVPGLPASLAAGDLMVMVAAIRNSGTGIPDTPSGWTRWAVFEDASNVQVFAKIAGAGEVAPTVTFTAGVANADTSAQIIRLVGKWHSATNALLAHASALNASAQDIAYPGLSLLEADNAIVLAIGWKQDDFTSVATLAGATEIAEASTTTGDDQSLVWDYTIQTTAAYIPPGSFVVTGGASATSRGAVVAIRCDYQTATVTRSVNGVVKAQVANEPVRLWNPWRWAL